MKSKQTNRFIVVLILTGFAISCSMFSGSNSNGNAINTKKKGPSATTVCQVLAHPDFESSFPYDGKGCSGSTYFGAKAGGTPPTLSDTRPSFSYAVIGENDKLEKVMLNLSKRQDGEALLAAEANAVAKMISGQPLPKDIETAVSEPFSTYTRRDQDWKIGDVKVTLLRTNDLTSVAFQF